MVDLIAELSATFDRCLDTARAKNADYAGKGDPFANFRAAEIVGVSMERAVLVRMMDKMKRASNLLDAEPAVAGESLADTLEDLINYAAILKAMRFHMTVRGAEDFEAEVAK